MHADAQIEMHQDRTNVPSVDVTVDIVQILQKKSCQISEAVPPASFILEVEVGARDREGDDSSETDLLLNEGPQAGMDG